MRSKRLIMSSTIYQSSYLLSQLVANLRFCRALFIFIKRVNIQVLQTIIFLIRMNGLSLLTVIFVWILIFCLALSYVTLFLPALYKQNRPLFFFICLIQIPSLLIGCVSYFKAIWISPGYSKQSLKFDYSSQVENMKHRAQQEKQFKILRKQKKLTGQIKKRQIQHSTANSYCSQCDNVKLSRVHHCRQCGRCIQRMDHHCPWVGNCVGKQNHKYFILFLFYISIALLTVSITILADYISGQVLLNHINRIDQIYYYIILMTGAMCLLLLLSIGFLLITQLMMVSSNITTLESFYDGIQLHNPFDKQSITQNIEQITGQSFWFLPTKPFPHQDTQANIALQFD